MSRIDARSTAGSGREAQDAAVERRLRRSDDPLIALERLLDAARALGGSEVLALADESGLLIAGSGHFGACEELAAQTAARQPANDRQAASVRALDLKGSRVLLCASGGDLDHSLSHAAQGARRILGRRAAGQR